MNKSLAVIVVALSGILLWVLFAWQPTTKQHNELATTSTMQGGDFTLQSHQGPVSLSDLRGKVVLIYFGYTWCPDICPTNLSMMAGALSQLSEIEANKVQGIFISVDPDRDSIERLHTYTHYFHESILGLTGNADEIKAITDRYGVAYQIVKQASETNYVVDHSSETYVVSPNGKLVETLPHAALPEQILAAIKRHGSFD